MTEKMCCQRINTHFKIKKREEHRQKFIKLQIYISLRNDLHFLNYNKLQKNIFDRKDV